MAKVKQMKPENEQVTTTSEWETKSSAELKDIQKELHEKSETLVKEMSEREYEIDFKNAKLLNSLIKFLEKDAPWGHTTATGLIMLYHNMREQKEIAKGKDWNGVIKLRAANTTILWTMVTKMTGSGFYEAKNFVELMAQVGESLSNAVQKCHEDNQELRDVHTDLSKIENLITEVSQKELVEGPQNKED